MPGPEGPLGGPRPFANNNPDMKYHAELQKGGRIVVPSASREAMNISPGDLLLVEITVIDRGGD